jgi:UDP-glucose 4-epimerase
MYNVKPHMNNIMITGGCGFIGANLVYMLVNSGYNVTVFDNLSRGKREYIDASCNHRFIHGDIRKFDEIAQACIGIDAVIHLAAYGSVIESVQNPDENFDVNVTGTFNVLKACITNNIGKVVFASTGGALIGNATPPVNEESVARPISPYGASKLCGEAYCSAFSGAYDMDITSLRFANVIGPISDHKKGAVTAFCKAILSGQPITIYGDGSASRDFLYVDDLCSGIMKSMIVDMKGYNVFHLAAGREVTVKELALLICDISGHTDHEIRFLDKRKGEVERNFADYRLARENINFSPSYSLEQALKITWDWFVEKQKK